MSKRKDKKDIHQDDPLPEKIQKATTKKKSNENAKELFLSAKW